MIVCHFNIIESSHIVMYKGDMIVLWLRSNHIMVKHNQLNNNMIFFEPIRRHNYSINVAS